MGLYPMNVGGGGTDNYEWLMGFTVSQGTNKSVTLTKDFKKILVISTDCRTNTFVISINGAALTWNDYATWIHPSSAPSASGIGCFVVTYPFSSGDVLNVRPSGGGNTTFEIIGIY